MIQEETGDKIALSEFFPHNAHRPDFTGFIRSPVFYHNSKYNIKPKTPIFLAISRMKTVDSLTSTMLVLIPRRNCEQKPKPAMNGFY